tara:strand:- start:44 stop:322 length:279 start_codon:yes stop_codon:yes gene_type:complete
MKKTIKIAEATIHLETDNKGSEILLESLSNLIPVLLENAEEIGKLLKRYNDEAERRALVNKYYPKGKYWHQRLKQKRNPRGTEHSVFHREDE